MRFRVQTELAMKVWLMDKLEKKNQETLLQWLYMEGIK